MEDESLVKWRLKYLKFLNLPISENIDLFRLVAFFARRVPLPDYLFDALTEAPNDTTSQCVSLFKHGS